jgi:hypothetical protein
MLPINHRRSNRVAHTEVVDPAPDIGDLHRVAAGEARVGGGGDEVGRVLRRRYLSANCSIIELEKKRWNWKWNS